MKRHVLFLSLILLGSLTAQGLLAQSMRGKVIDSTTRESLSFANIVLLQASDSSFITGTVSGEEGTFSLASPVKKAVLRVSLIGYETYTEPFRPLDSRVIALTPKQEMLSEVVVTGQAKLFKLENGGISADVRNTPLATLGNLSEVLGQMPFVSKTDNAFTVLGKGTPIVYINNRLVRDNNDLLRVNSKDIKKVTVITNPGAEYDASVNAVIKVETSRPVGEGLSVDLWTYNRYNSEWYTMNRASFNYRKNKLDLFAQMEYGNMAFPKDRVWHTDIQTEEGVRSMVSKRSDSDMMKFYQPKGGFNYIVNENHSLGAQYEYFNMYDGSYDYLIDTESSLAGIVEEPVRTRSHGNNKNHTHYVNAYYDGQIADWLDAKLDMDYKTAENEGYDGAANTSEERGDESLRTLSSGHYDLYAAKLTLRTPLWGSQLTYGAEGSYTKNEQATDVEVNDGIPGIHASRNDVKQNLYAAFVSYNRSFGSFSGDIGLRYEHVNSEYHKDGMLVEEQSRRYQRLFPTFRLSYNLNEEVQMELAYRNTVSRPSYHSLRSSIAYMGPYQYATGNPSLQPAYTNNLTYTLRWKQFTLMGVYRNSKDLMVEMATVYMGDSYVGGMSNIDRAQFLTVALNYNSKFGIWRPNYDLSLDKNYVTIGEDPGFTYNKPSFSFNLRNGFSLKGWNFGVDISGRSKGNRSYYVVDYDTDFSWSTDLYVNTSFFNDRLLVGLRGIDIFATRKDNVSYDFDGIHRYMENSMYRRTFMFSMTYRFNASPKRYKGSNATDEIRRL